MRPDAGSRTAALVAAIGAATATAALLPAPPARAQIELPEPKVDPADIARGPSGGPAGRRAPPNVFVSPSGEPFRAGPEAPYAVADWFRRADADGDGRLTRAEFLADADRFFRTLDTDHDGVIDGFEIRAYEETVAPEILPRVGRLSSGEGQDRALFHDRDGGVESDGGRNRRGGREDGGGQAERRGRITAADIGFSGAGAYGVLNEPEPVQACDTDLDGRVSLAEWRAKAVRRFALLDGKALGYLTLDGLPKSYVQQAREKAAKERAKAAERERPPR